MRMKVIVAFVIRDLKLMLRDKTLLFWVVAWPLIWVFMTAYVFVPLNVGGGTITLKLGVVNLDASQTPFNGSSLVRILEEAEYNGSKLFSVETYPTGDEALKALRRGELDAAIVIPEGFGHTMVNPEKVRLHVYIGVRTPQSAQITSSIITGFLNEFSKKLSLERVRIVMDTVSQLPVPEEGRLWLNSTFQSIAQPSDLTIEYLAPETFEDRARILGWYTIGAVGMMLLYSGFSSGATLLVSEKDRGTLRKLFSTPLTEGEFLAGGFLSQLAILLISTLILMLVGVSPAVGARIALDPLNLIHILAIAFLVCGALMSMSIGALISLLSKTEKGAGSLGTILGILLTFTTGIWFPMEWMPQPIRIMAAIFPPAWSIEASRSILVYETALEKLVIQAVKIFSSTAILLVSALLVYRAWIKKYLES